jgi:hypothetical protein
MDKDLIKEIRKNREGIEGNRKVIEKNREVINKISIQVIKNSQKIGILLTREAFNKKMEEFSQGQDKVITILNRLDQERVFTIERIKRIEEEVERIKAHLALK